MERSICKKCGRLYCGHTPEERGMTFHEMVLSLTDTKEPEWHRQQSKQGDKSTAQGIRT
jgi:hypothetical protein